MKKLFLAAFAACCLAQTGQGPAPKVAAASLKADVSFLASDAMEGRATPSKTLEIAAEFIASEYRRAGLEPAGDDGYFQTASYESVKPNTEGLELTLFIGGKPVKVESDSLLLNQQSPLTLDNEPALRVAMADLASLTPEQVRGKALIVEGSSGRMSATTSQAALVILIAPQPVRTGARTSLRAATPPDTRAPLPAPVPTVLVWDAKVHDALAAAKDVPVSVTARIPAPLKEPVKLKNVIGVLRGSDPALKDTYLILSAHYDHLGMRATGDGDRIFNGADDDASGTASIIEIAEALSALPARPKRTIVFLAHFGEEVGEIGSQYYAQHPVFSVAKTIANVNLEQLGRTDDSEGPKVGMFNMTGYTYTNMAPVFEAAARESGVRAVNDEKNSDSYFGRSDNAKYAAVGIPSTTISVAYMFPDYHAVGDEWPKLDYENMAKVDTAIALAAFRLADSADEPQWNKDNPRTAAYRQAREKR